MAKFRIWCRTDAVGKSQYLAVVTAIPDSQSPGDSSSRIESESRLLASMAIA